MIVESIGILKTTVQHVLRDDLKKRKLCSVLQVLTTEQWQQRVSHAKNLLEIIENDPDFVDSITTGNDSWCCTYNNLMVGTDM